MEYKNLFFRLPFGSIGIVFVALKVREEKLAVVARVIR